MRLAISSDEEGRGQRARLAATLIANGHEVTDAGPQLEGCSTPNYAYQVAVAVCRQGAERGIIISDRPIGASVIANRLPGIRAALCVDAYSAHVGAEQEGMNVLVLPSQSLREEQSQEIVNVYLGVSLAPVAIVGGLPPLRLQRVLSHINLNITKELSVAELAKVVGMSQYYFSKLFKLSTGTTPHQYVMRRRVEHAQELLRETSTALSHVATQSGFETQSHFTSVFRRLVGATPKSYRAGTLLALEACAQQQKQDNAPKERKAATAA